MLGGHSAMMQNKNIKIPSNALKLKTDVLKN